MNPLQPNGGGQAAFVTTIDASKSGAASLVNSTFMGGANDSAAGRGLAVDAQGNIYLTGTTSAADFVTIGPAQGGYAGGSDAFLAKLSPASGQTDLAVVITANPDPVKQGNNITYTITVTNQGPDAVSGAFLSDQLDTGTTFISSVPAPTSSGNGALGFSLGPIAAGGSTQIQVTVRFDTPSFSSANGAGQTTNTATVIGDRPDPNPANNTFTYTAQATSLHADLALNVTLTPLTIVVGQNFVYNLNVTNNGPDDAQNVVLTENLPPQATFLSANPGPATNAANVLTFNLGTIPSGQTVTVKVSMRPLPGVGGFVHNSASVTTTSLDTNSANNSVTRDSVVASPDQSDLNVTISGPTFSVSTTGIAYTATVTNNGPHTADNVVFKGDVTALDTIATLNASQGTVSQANDAITALLGALAPGQSATVTFTVNTGASDTSVTVDGSATADENDPFLNDNSASTRTKVGQGAITFVVTNTNDSGPGSLRQAISDSESQGSTLALPNHIVFAIPETDPGKDPNTGAFVIHPLTPLPPIFQPSVIDGYTQPGSSPNTNPIDQADNAKIRVEIDGSQAGRPADGLELFAAGCTVRGLAINSFITKLQRGTTTNLLLDGVGIFVFADHETIAGNFIGTDASGMVAHGNEVQGIALFGFDNTIGGTDPADRNLISGNGAAGVGIASSETGNKIIGNFIGTNATGAAALPTNLLTVAGFRLASEGLLLEGSGDFAGGTTPAERNVISGNAGDGVGLLRATNTDPRSSAAAETVIGNYIGTDPTGTKAVPNGLDGVSLRTGVGNSIGGTAPGQRNIIAGNNNWGIDIQENNNTIAGNYVGTDASGLLPLGNGLGGINIGSSNNTVNNNLVAANNGPGILTTAFNSSFLNNVVGADAGGNPLGNNGDGVRIQQPSGTSSGTTAAQSNTLNGNTISFNLGAGVAILATDSSLGGGTANQVADNSIFSNTGLGIDLGDDGVTPNGPALQTRAGANHLQNYPVLTSAVSAGGSTTILGTFVGLANHTYQIDLYANTFLDPTGFGEGQTWLGTASATADASGNGSFTATFPVDLGGQYITATASTPNGVSLSGDDTSEFSQGLQVTGGTPTPPPSTSADLSIVGNVLTASPQVGQPLSYSFTVKNNGPDAAHGVIFSETIPTQNATLLVDNVSATSTAGVPSINNGVITVNLGTLAGGASQTITISLLPHVAGALSLPGSVSATESDPNTSNNTTTLSPTIAAGVVGTDVAVTVKAPPGPYRVGDEILYTVDMINNGPLVATGVILQETLPSGAQYVAADSSPGLLFNTGSNAVSINAGALAPGDDLHAFIAARFAAAGQAVDTASVSADQADTVSGNNTATLTTNVLKGPSVTVLLGPSAPTNPNQTAAFPVSVSTPSAVVQPSGTVTFTEGNNTLGQGSIDGSGKITFNVPLTSGVHTLNASYSGDANFNPSVAPLVFTVAGAPANSADLTVTGQASPNPVTVGSPLSYTFTVMNNGPNAASNVTLTDTLPANVAFVSASLGTFVSGKLTAVIGDLAAGTSQQVTLVVTPSVAGALADTAAVGATESDPNPANNSATANVTVQAANIPNADLVATVVPSPLSVAQGQNVSYLVTAANHGPNDATGVNLTVTLGTGLTFVSTNQGTASGNVVTIPIGALAQNANDKLIIVARATGAGSLDLTANVTSASPTDLNASNNTMSTAIVSNAPNTLNSTLAIDFGTVTTPEGSGFAPQDGVTALGDAVREYPERHSRDPES